MSLEQVYKCNECGDVHRYEDDAQSCCQPSISEGYQCPECDAFHATEFEANNCCAEEGAAPIISPRDLEDAGQLRLTP